MTETILIGENEFTVDDNGEYMGKMMIWGRVTDVFLTLEEKTEEDSDRVLEKINWLNANREKVVDAFMADYDAMDDLIFKATGQHSTMLRFPGGSNASYNKAIRPQLLQAVRDRGIVYFDWNSFDGDVEGKRGQELIDQTIRQVNENTHSILLMHDMPSTAFVHDALPTIIERLKADGYKFELLNENTPPRQFAK